MRLIILGDSASDFELKISVSALRNGIRPCRTVTPRSSRKALAVADETRNAQLPAVPTTTETGLPKLQATYWNGVLAPAGTPTNIVGKLNAAINEIMKSPDLQATLVKLSAKPKIGSPQDFAAFIAAERKKWTEVADAAGVKVD